MCLGGIIRILFVYHYPKLPTCIQECRHTQIAKHMQTSWQIIDLENRTDPLESSLVAFFFGGVLYFVFPYRLQECMQVKVCMQWTERKN